MSKIVFVIPKEGCIVRDPVTKNVIPAEGKKIRMNTYWQRRIADGDVVLCEQENSLFQKGE